MGFNDHDSETTPPLHPFLYYSNLSGVTLNGVATTTLTIPMILTTYQDAAYKTSFNTAQFIPLIGGGGLGYGGSAITDGATQFPKLMLEGSIDTPLVAATEDVGTPVMLSQLQVNGVNIHYVEFIAMMFEGRGGSAIWWARSNPDNFTDPYGRVFLLPQILDYTATYLEGVPTRANFTMQLKVK